MTAATRPRDPPGATGSGTRPHGMDQAPQPAVHLVDRWPRGDHGRPGHARGRRHGGLGPSAGRPRTSTGQQRARRGDSGPAAAGALGVLAMTSEYTSGMIRATLAAAPRRVRWLWPQGRGVGAAVLRIGEVLAFLAFFAGGGRMLHAPVPAGHPGQPGGAAGGAAAGAYWPDRPARRGAGAIIRHTAAAIAVLSPACVIGLITAAAAHDPAGLPAGLQHREFADRTIRPENSAPGPGRCPYFLTPWVGLGVLSLYAAVALAVGGWLLARRDA